MVSDPDFEATRRRLMDVRRRYADASREVIPDPREFYEAERRKFSHLPDLSGNTRLDDMRRPQGYKMAAQGIAECTVAGCLDRVLYGRD